jgi:hypothetical protein
VSFEARAFNREGRKAIAAKNAKEAVMSEAAQQTWGFGKKH